MTNEEKINEIINHLRKETADLGFCFDCAMEDSARVACRRMAAWKDEQIERMKCCYNCANWRDGLCDHVGGDVMADFVCGNWTMEGGEE